MHPVPALTAVNPPASQTPVRIVLGCGQRGLVDAPLASSPLLDQSTINPAIVLQTHTTGLCTSEPTRPHVSPIVA